MDSGKKILGLMLALVLITTLGCSKNKQQQAPAYPAGTGYSQPPVNAAAPSSSGARSSSYIK